MMTFLRKPGLRFVSMILCFAFIGTALMVSLTGCHGAREQSNFVMPDSFDTDRKFELVFWSKNDTNKTQANIYTDAIARFEALYPNIHVKIQPYTNYGDIYNDVITNLSTGTTPNVCISYPDHVATYLSGGETVVQLDQLMSDPRYGLGGSEVRFRAPGQDGMIGKFMDECFLNGHYYAMPFMRSTEACYINKTYVEKLGFTVPETLTWDFIWEVSDAAAEKDENGLYAVNGQKVMIPFIYKSTDNMMIQYLRQKDAPYATVNGDIQIFNDTTRDFLYTVAEHTEKKAFSTFKISSYPANFLNAGQCIFAIDSTAGATWMGTKAPLLDIPEEQLVDFELAVRPVPQVDPEHKQMISQGPSLCIFNKEDPQEVLASWLFVQFLLTDEVQIAYAQTEGYVPVTHMAQDSEVYLDYLSRGGEDNQLHYDVKIQATKMLIENTENTFTTPVFIGSASLRDAAGQMIENVTKSVRRKQTVDDVYMDNLFKEMQSLHRLNVGEGGSTTAVYRQNFGPLPQTAVYLLIGLGVAWVGIGAYSIYNTIKQKKKGK